MLGSRKPPRPYYNLLCCLDSTVCLSLLELISCPGCQRIYLTRDVTEHIFLQCFSPGKPTMARVSQDKEIYRWWFTEIDETPVYRSSLCPWLVTPLPAILIHPSVHPSSIYPPTHPSTHPSIHSGGNKKCSNWEKQSNSLLCEITCFERKVKVS